MKAQRMLSRTIHNLTADHKASAEHYQSLVDGLHPALLGAYEHELDVHLEQLTQLRADLSHLEHIRSGVKKIRSMGDEMSAGLEKLNHRLLKANEWTQSVLEELGGQERVEDARDGVMRQLGIEVEEYERHMRGGMADPTSGGADTEGAKLDVLLHLLQILQAIQVHLMGSVGSLKGQMEDQWVAHLQHFIKDTLRDARYQGLETVKAQTAYQDALKALNQVVVSEEEQATKESVVNTAKRKLMAVRSKHVLTYAASPFSNAALPDPLPSPSPFSDESPAQLQARANLKAASEKLDMSNRKSVERATGVHHALERDQIPMVLLSHLKQVKRFFRQSLEKLDEICPDEDIETMHAVLKFRAKMDPASPPTLYRNSTTGARSNTSSVYEVARDASPAPSSSTASVTPPAVPPKSPNTFYQTLSNPPKARPPSPPKTPHPESLTVDSQGSDMANVIKEERLVVPRIQGLDNTQSLLMHCLAYSDLLRFLVCTANNDPFEANYQPSQHVSITAMKHLNTSVKCMDELGLLDAFLIETVLKRGDFGVLKGVLKEWLNGTSPSEVIVFPAIQTGVDLESAVSLLGFSQSPSFASSNGNGPFVFEWLVLKQVFVNLGRHYVQKTITSILNDAQVTPLSEFTLLDFSRRSLKTLIAHRGLIPRSLKNFISTLLASLPSFLEWDLAKTRGDQHLLAEGENQSEITTALLLFHLMILPCLLHPEQWGLQAPWTNGNSRSMRVHELYIGSHRDEMRFGGSGSGSCVVSPGSRSPAISFIAGGSNDASNEACPIQKRMHDLHAVLSDFVSCYLGFSYGDHGVAKKDDDSNDLTHEMIVQSMHREFETPLHNFLVHFYSARSNAFSVASTTTVSMGSGDLRHIYMTQELDLLMEDFVIPRHAVLPKCLEFESDEGKKWMRELCRVVEEENTRSVDVLQFDVPVMSAQELIKDEVLSSVSSANKKSERSRWSRMFSQPSVIFSGSSANASQFDSDSD